MFDIGFWELLVIAVVLLLVMGPERLPEVARQAAFLVRKARQGMFRLRNEMKSEIDATPFADLQKARQEMTDFKNDIRQFGRELADSAEEKINVDGEKTAPDAEDPLSTVGAGATTKAQDAEQGAARVTKKKRRKQNKKVSKVAKKTTPKGAKKTTKKARKKTATTKSA